MSVGDTIRLAGYAIRYDVVSTLYEDDAGGGYYLTIAPGAFKKAIAAGLKAPLQIAAHDGDIIGEVGHWFEDDVGLGWWADISREYVTDLATITAAAKPADHCSLMLVIDEETTAEDPHLGSPLRVVTRASAEHLAVGLTRAAFAGSKCWVPSEFNEHTPHAILDLNAVWRETYLKVQTARLDKRMRGRS